MNKNYTIIVCLFLLLATALSGQAPQLLNYQAIVRDSNGQALAQGVNVSIQFIIHEDSATGNASFTEGATLTTGIGGLIIAKIGSSGNLSAVNWASGEKFLQVKIDPTGGTDYADMGTTQLLSVPYALFAANSADGPPGATGPAGPTGIDGMAGVTGPAGNNGPPGATGPIGLNGAPGTPGVNGATGPTGPLGNAGGDLNGAYPDPTVTGLQNKPVSNAMPDTGQVLQWNGSVWIPANMPDTNLFWKVNGNSKTTTANFLGTINNVPLSLRSNDTLSGYINNTTSNTFWGYRAGISTIGGYSNTYIGQNAGQGNTSGFSNVAIGNSALFSDSDHFYLIAIGDSALFHNQTDHTAIQDGGSQNIAIGFQSMFANTIGWDNTAIGFQALMSNTSGRGNVALGAYSLLYNTTGQGNTGIGAYTLILNTTGSYNTAMSGSLADNTTGSYNTAVGNGAMTANDKQSYNSAFGFDALVYSTADNNTAVGYYAGAAITTQTDNTCVGYIAGSGPFSDKNFSHSTFIGSGAYPVDTMHYYNQTGLGYGALTNASNQVRIGNNAVTSIGGYADWTNVSDERVKKNIRENIPGLDFIRLLRPVTYNLDMNQLAVFLNNGSDRPAEEINAESAKEQILYSGFIAQDVEKAARQVNYNFSGVDKPENPQSLYGLRYAEFVVPLVKAVQELDAKTREQQRLIEKLEREITELKKR